MKGRESAPLKLLGYIPVRLLHDLLHDANVPFGILAKGGGFGKNGFTSIIGGVDELLGEFIQMWKTASEIVETPSDGALSTTLFVQEINERLLAPAAGVGNGIPLVFFALREERKRGVGLDAIHRSDELVVTCVGIHHGEDTVFLILEVSRDILVDGFHSFAVSTPRSGEGNKNVLCFVQDDGVEVVHSKGNNFGWGRRLNIRLDTSLGGNAVRGSI